MNNVIAVTEIIEEYSNNEDFKIVVKECGLKPVHCEIIKQAMLFKALELNNSGIYLPKEIWELVYTDALERYATRDYDEHGNLLPRPRNYSKTCVFNALVEHSPVEIPNSEMVDKGEYDPHFNDFGDGNHVTR